MKNKKIILLIISVLLLSVAGCGDGMTPQEREEADRQQSGATEVVGVPIDGGESAPMQSAEPDEVNTELEQQIQELERRCGTPDFSQEEYLSLAELYGENSQVKKQRDTLEICVALLGDAQAREELEQLTVNAAEEEPDVQGQMTLLEQNLSIQGYIDEAVTMLCGEEWRDTMMPRLTQGTRGYYQEQGERSLYVRTGYDASGAFYTQVQYQAEGQITVLLQTDESVQLLESGVEEGQYNGVYECWTVLAASGDVIRENGNMRDGILVGDYTAQIRWGKGENELLPLWNLREDMEMVTYSGNFGEDGISTAAQLEEETAGMIVYAYDSSRQNYLFVSGGETAAAENFVFYAQSMNMPAPRTYAAYEPKEDRRDAAASGTVDITELQVRVFDGNIEVYDGNGWVNMGSAQTYIQADPVAVQAAAGSQTLEGGENVGTEGQGIAAAYARRGGGQVTPAATPKPTSRPTAPVTPAAPVTPVAPAMPTVPAVVPTPAPTPVPAQPSNPQPAPQPSNPQPSNPQPAPQPTPEPTPQPTPEPAPPTPEPAPTDPPITGGDSDVEWTPDLM